MNKIKNYKKIILIAILIGLLIAFINRRDNRENVVLNIVEEEYQITLYDNHGRKILSETYPVEPGITEINKDILEISISTGSPSRASYYFDKETSNISTTFFNPIIWGNENIAYMNAERTLILTDLFEQGIIYKEIKRDFSETANPISAIISIEAIDDKNIELTYYSGPDYVEKTEVMNYTDKMMSESKSDEAYGDY